MVNKLGCRGSARTEKDNPGVAILKNDRHNHGTDAYGKSPYRPWKNSHKNTRKGGHKNTRASTNQKLNTYVKKRILESNENTSTPSPSPVEPFFNISEVTGGVILSDSLIPEIQIKEEPLSD